MPGIVTQFVLLDLVKARLANNRSAGAKQILAVLDAEPGYAYLGAVGPDLMDFMPINLETGVLGGGANSVVSSPYFQFWQLVFQIAGGNGTVKGLVATLANLNSLLNQLNTIAGSQNLGALQTFLSNGNVTNTVNAMTDLANIVANIQNNLVHPFILNITIAQKPAVSVDATTPPIAWDCRDFMFWKKTGAFVNALIKNAGTDNRFLAYAYGYAVAYTAKVCGSPFLNSIVGSTYRLNWWRVRWLNLFGDAWVYGFYNTQPVPTMNGDTPSNPNGYAAWPSLCSANLQKKIELLDIDMDPNQLIQTVSGTSGTSSFPSTYSLPSKFTQFWFNTFTQIYAPPAASQFSADGLNGAYLLTWLMLWFQTSGQGLGCNPAPPMTPPSDSCATQPCATQPTSPPPPPGTPPEPCWVNPVNNAGPNGGPEPPPPPSSQPDPNRGGEACAIIEALLGLGETLSGNVAGAIGLVINGVTNAITDANEINWSNLSCQIYWYQMYLYNGINILHQVAELVGIVHPYAPELQQDTTVSSAFGTQFGPFNSGDQVVKSQSPVQGFPAGLWSLNLLSINSTAWFANPIGPNQPSEEPATIPYLTVAYPNFWIDDAVNNPLSNGQVRVGGAWPQVLSNTTDARVPVQFGNAVDNAIDVLLNSSATLPDWNLDGDRGLAYLTWQFQGSSSNPVQIEPES